MTQASMSWRLRFSLVTDVEYTLTAMPQLQRQKDRGARSGRPSASCRGAQQGHPWPRRHPGAGVWGWPAAGPPRERVDVAGLGNWPPASTRNGVARAESADRTVGGKASCRKFRAWTAQRRAGRVCGTGAAGAEGLRPARSRQFPNTQRPGQEDVGVPQAARTKPGLFRGSGLCPHRPGGGLCAGLLRRL